MGLERWGLRWKGLPSGLSQGGNIDWLVEESCSRDVGFGYSVINGIAYRMSVAME
jgi:hypothetical protein